MRFLFQAYLISTIKALSIGNITSWVGKVDDFELGDPPFESCNAIWENSTCAVGQGTSPKVVLYNDHLLCLDYEYGNGTLKYVKHS